MTRFESFLPSIFCEKKITLSNQPEAGQMLRIEEVYLSKKS